MAYTKTVWKNRQVEKPRTYTMTDNGDGTITLDRAPGEVYEAGTAMNADNMNHLEEGMEAAHNNQKNHEDAENPHKGSASLTHASRHRTDGEDPLTLEMLGAAPAGYGLGTYGKASSNFNTAVKSGFYAMAGDGVQNVPAEYAQFAYGTMLVENRLGVIVKQTLFYNGDSAIRWSTDGGSTWQPLEWLNPPMNLGVEYRTTERYNNLPVYVKLVDCGELPNTGTKNVYLGDNIIGENVVSYDVKLLSGTKGAHMLPWLDTSFNGQARAYISSAGHIQFVSNSDMSAYTAIVTVKYTKP